MTGCDYFEHSVPQGVLNTQRHQAVLLTRRLNNKKKN